MGIFDKIKSFLTSDKPKPAPQADMKPQAKQQPAQTGYADSKPPSQDLPRDIRGVLAAYFPQYAVRENVAVTEISASQDFGGPINFVLSKEGRTAAVIMLIRNKRNKRFWGVEKACAAKGVKLMNFYYHQWFTREGAARYMSKFI